VLAAKAAGCKGAIVANYPGGAGAGGRAESWGSNAVVKGISGVATLAPALFAEVSC